MIVSGIIHNPQFHPALSILIQETFGEEQDIIYLTISRNFPEVGSKALFKFTDGMTNQVYDFDVLIIPPTGMASGDVYTFQYGGKDIYFTTS